MNVIVQSTISQESDETVEGLLLNFNEADDLHRVYAAYGKPSAHFYQVQNGLELNGKSVNQRLALPMFDNLNKLVGIAFVSHLKSDKPLFYPSHYPTGSVIFGTPAKDKPLCIVSSIDAAFAISHTGLPCLLTFTPFDWGGKHVPLPKDSGNFGRVISDWSMAGYTRLYAPVASHLATTYRLWLKDSNVQVLPLPAPIDQYLATPALKAELIVLMEATDTTQICEALAIIEQAFLLAEDCDNPDVGALWEQQTILALRYIYSTNKPEWARQRVRLKQCKSVKLSEIEREIIGKADDKGYADACSVLIDVATASCTFIHDPDLEPYAIIAAGNARLCWHLHSKSFGEWLSHAYYKSEGMQCLRSYCTMFNNR